MFITEALAATETAAAVAEPSPMAGFLVQLILVFAIFYFLLIRPQQKKMKEREDMLNAIKSEDKIITGGGVYGRVIKTENDILVVEIAKDVEVRISRDSIRENLSVTPVKTEK